MSYLRPVSSLSDTGLGRQSGQPSSLMFRPIPMMLAYPFIQKYFTKGTMLGSVKG